MTSGNQQANLAAQMQFGPLLYSYQLAMAQAQQAQQQQQAPPPPPKPAPKAKCEFDLNLNLNRIQVITLILSPSTAKPPTSNNVAMDMQRALEMQRQYIEMLTQVNQHSNQRGGHNNYRNN